jgi:hypothetical protein
VLELGLLPLLALDLLDDVCKIWIHWEPFSSGYVKFCFYFSLFWNCVRTYSTSKSPQPTIGWAGGFLRLALRLGVNDWLVDDGRLCNKMKCLRVKYCIFENELKLPIAHIGNRRTRKGQSVWKIIHRLTLLLLLLDLDGLLRCDGLNFGHCCRRVCWLRNRFRNCRIADDYSVDSG